MKPILALLAGVLCVAGCSDADTRVRYQLITTAPTDSVSGEKKPLVIRLDTITGHAWTYELTTVSNQNLQTFLPASGWHPIPDSFDQDIVKQLNVAPKLPLP